MGRRPGVVVYCHTNLTQISYIVESLCWIPCIWTNRLWQLLCSLLPCLIFVQVTQVHPGCQPDGVQRDFVFQGWGGWGLPDNGFTHIEFKPVCQKRVGWQWIVTKVTLLLYVCINNGATWILENPSSSLDASSETLTNTRWLQDWKRCHLNGSYQRMICLPYNHGVMAGGAKIGLHRRFKQLLQRTESYQTYTWLGMYGGKTPKPIRLWSNADWVENMKRTPGLFMYTAFGFSWSRVYIYHYHWIELFSIYCQHLV